MRISTVILLGCALAGCSTAAEQEATRIKDSVVQAQPALDACTAKLYGSAQYAVLGPKLIVWDGQPTLAQQTDQTKATPEEARMLLELHDGYIMPFRQIRMQAAANSISAWMPVLTDGYAKQDAVFAQVAKGQMTYGDANRQIAAIKSEAMAKAEAINRQVAGSLSKAHAAESAQRAAAMQRLGDSMAAYGAYLQTVNKPTTTNCYRFGNMVQCQSY